MDEAIRMLEGLFDRTYDALDFSFEFQDYLCGKYAKMYKDNPRLTELLNENMPEITDIMERGMDPEPFIQQVKAEYERIIAILNED